MSSTEPSSSGPRKPLAKPLLGVVLVVIALGAVVIGVTREAAPPKPAEVAAAPQAQAEVVTVYYFHGDTRCDTCLAIEAATERIVREWFAKDLAAGTLRYEAVNYEAPANQHFREAYSLAYGTVVVQGVGELRPWKNLSKVWEFIHDDPTKLDAYLVDSIAPMLEGQFEGKLEGQLEGRG